MSVASFSILHTVRTVNDDIKGDSLRNDLRDGDTPLSLGNPSLLFNLVRFPFILEKIVDYNYMVAYYGLLSGVLTVDSVLSKTFGIPPSVL